MESVLCGPNNWKLIIRRSENGIIILRASTCDTHAALPDVVQGLPVVELGPNAMSPQCAEVEGEEILIANGTPPPKSEWSSEKLIALSLPSSIRKIHSFAFLNCRELQHLELYGNVENWGNGIFTGCQKLHIFTIHSGNSPTCGTAVWYIASTMMGDLDVTIETGREKARLIFPEYEEYEEENLLAQAVMFSFHIAGAGYQYHQCFTGRKLDFTRYDNTWKAFMGLNYHPVDAIRIAFWRLFHPVSLAERHQLAYMEYLKKHAGPAVQWLTETRNAKGLAYLLKHTEPDRDALNAACDLARSSGFTEAGAILLEALHKRFPQRNSEIFDL